MRDAAALTILILLLLTVRVQIEGRRPTGDLESPAVAAERATEPQAEPGTEPQAEPSTEPQDAAGSEPSRVELGIAPALLARRALAAAGPITLPMPSRTESGSGRHEWIWEVNGKRIVIVVDPPRPAAPAPAAPEPCGPEPNPGASC